MPSGAVMRVGGRVEVEPAGQRERDHGVGRVTKLSVLAEPSLRFGKLRLKQLTIVLAVIGDLAATRSHWPMHGPQALASTVAPMASRSAIRPSRSMVARICSDPGVISRSVFDLAARAADAWRATDAARVMSSYEQFVQEPISAALISSGQPLAPASLADVRADAVGAVGGVRSVDQRLELVEVDLDELVVRRRRRRGAARRPPCRRRRRWPRGRWPSGTRPCSGRSRTGCRWRRSRRPCCRSWPCRWPRCVSAPGP